MLLKTPISIKIIGQEFIVGDTIKVDYDSAKGEYMFVKLNPQPTTGLNNTQPGQPIPPGAPTQPGVVVQNGVSQDPNATVLPVQPLPPANGMIVDPYTPVVNPMTPAPFSPFTADGSAIPAPQPSQPTLGADGTQMQPDPTQVQ